MTDRRKRKNHFQDGFPIFFYLQKTSKFKPIPGPLLLGCSSLFPPLMMIGQSVAIIIDARFVATDAVRAQKPALYRQFSDKYTSWLMLAVGIA